MFDFFFSSVSSFPSNHNSAPHVPGFFDVESDHDQSDGSQVETEADWIDNLGEEHPVAHAFSKMLAMVINEVSYLHWHVVRTQTNCSLIASFVEGTGPYPRAHLKPFEPWG